MRIAALLLLVAGCTTIGHQPPPADWPNLTIVEHQVGTWSMLKHCYQYVSLPMKLIGGIPFSCAEVNFPARRCDIWCTEDMNAETLEHERLHCAGYDHFGASTLADAWRDYKAGLAR